MGKVKAFRYLKGLTPKSWLINSFWSIEELILLIPRSIRLYNNSLHFYCVLQSSELSLVKFWCNYFVFSIIKSDFLCVWSAQPSILTVVTIILDDYLKTNPWVKDYPWPGIKLQPPCAQSRDGPWPDPTRAYFWLAVNKRPTQLWSGYFPTCPEAIFLIQREENWKI